MLWEEKVQTQISDVMSRNSFRREEDGTHEGESEGDEAKESSL